MGSKIRAGPVPCVAGARQNAPLIALDTCDPGLIQCQNIDFYGIDQGLKPFQQSLVHRMLYVVLVGCLAFEAHDSGEGIALAVFGFVVAHMQFEEAWDVSLELQNVVGGAGLLRFGCFGFPLEAENVKVHTNPPWVVFRIQHLIAG
jgi:hypothetical protein